LFFDQFLFNLIFIHSSNKQTKQKTEFSHSSDFEALRI
jgi:hypothetical protein